MRIKQSTKIPKTNFEFQALSVANNYRNALVKEFSDQLYGRVVEVGAGIGQMTALLQKLPGITFLQCVEPNPDFCLILKKNFPFQSLTEGTIQNVDKDEWNVIISVNVLEHIEDDEDELKMYCERLRKEKGTLNLFVPARPEIYAPIDKDLGHCRRYTKREIMKKLTSAGFEIEKIKYFNFVGYFAWWLNFCFMKRRSFNINSVSFFDRFIFPAMYFLESRISAAPIGQNLLITARAK